MNSSAGGIIEAVYNRRNSAEGPERLLTTGATVLEVPGRLFTTCESVLEGLGR